MPLLITRTNEDGQEQWMCGNCFGFVAPRESISIPMESPCGKERKIPYCVPCVDSVDYTVTNP